MKETTVLVFRFPDGSSNSSIIPYDGVLLRDRRRHFLVLLGTI